MSAAFMQYWALCYFENLTNSIPDNPQKFQNFGHFRNYACRLIEKNWHVLCVSGEVVMHARLKIQRFKFDSLWSLQCLCEKEAGAGTFKVN